MLGGAACRTEMDHEPINEIDHVYKKRVEFCLPWTYFRDFVLTVYLLWTWSVSLIGSWSISVRHAPPPQSENQTGREATGREPLPAPQPTWISDRNGDSISKSAIQRRFDIHRRSIGDSISKSVEGGAGCAPQTIDRSIDLLAALVARAFRGHADRDDSSGDPCRQSFCWSYISNGLSEKPTVRAPSVALSASATCTKMFTQLW
jgi:hypothetical protein